MMEKQTPDTEAPLHAEHPSPGAQKPSDADVQNLRLRLRFEKTGRAVYISHLDLMTTMQRAFARADVMLRYSEGFNPHPLISILLPLSVGTGSVCELMDFRLREENFQPEDPSDAREMEERVSALLGTLPERLNRALPEGIRVLEAWPAARKGAALKWLEVEGTMEYDRTCPPQEALAEFFSRESIPVEKKTKRGMGIMDLKPAIRWIRFEKAEAAGENTEDAVPCMIPPAGTIRVQAMISAQEPTLNPELLVNALRQAEPALCPDFARFLRLETFDAEGNLFR